MMKIGIVMTLILCPLVVAAKPYRAFIIAGQSNAQGYGYAAGRNIKNQLIPNTNLEEAGRSDLLEKSPDVRIFHGDIDSGNGQWAELDAACGISWNGTRFGPELSFGHKIHRELGEPVALIKYAKGGTSLADGAGSKGKPINDWYLEDKIENQYDFFIKTVRLAISQAQEQGDTLDIQGMLWMQGEADSRLAHTAAAYEENLTAFIARVRQDLGLPQLKVYLGSIADSLIWKNRETIWSAQENVEMADEDVFIVNAKDLPLFKNDGDNCADIHYTTEAQVALGERFADAVLSSKTF